MVTRIMLPCEGFSPVWEWMNMWQFDAFRRWWGNSARLVRKSVGAPDWAEYVDRDGNAWTREGLLARMIQDALDLYGEAHVDATIERVGHEGMRAAFDGWIECRVFAGELVRLIDGGAARQALASR